MEKTNASEKVIARFGIAGLILNLIFIAVCLPFFNIIVFMTILFPVLGLIPLLLPFLGITLGICGIANHFDKANKNKKTRYLVINIINAVLPIIVIATITILLSTGVVVIRFM